MDMTNLKRLGPSKWRIRFKYRDPLTGQQKIYHETFNGTLSDARARRDEQKVRARAGSLSPAPPAQGRTLADYVDSYVAMRTSKSGRGGRPIRRATLEKEYYTLKDHVLPDVGDWILTEIKTRHLEELQERWTAKEKPNGDRYASSTINTWSQVLTLFMRHAFRVASLGESPAEHLPKVAGTTREGRALNANQVRRVLDQLKIDYPQWYAFAFLGFTTGARFSEISALHWEDIDEAGKVLHLGHSQYRGTRKKLNKAGRYVQIPLVPTMANVLRWHRRRLIEHQHPGLATSIVFPADVEDASSATQRGYVSPTGLTKALTRTCRVLSIPRITPHDMRRTFNTLMLEAGVEKHVLQAMTGHSTDEMTIHYSHISLDYKSGALNRMIEHLG